ncbi:583_t:CDS:1 [Funneliformis geosporum]|nr:583_t:CDS:1 [Funneliformis geosporum]
MNKKIIFYFLTALVVLTFKTDSSYSIPTISKYDENYWTPEKMKNAKPLTIKNIGLRTRSGDKTIKNTTDSSKVTKSMQPLERKYDANTKVANVEANVDQVNNIPIGRLFMSKNGVDYSCTASVINTNDGNIGFSAAHCLYHQNTSSYFDNVMFSPGYDNDQDGPIGRVPIAKMAVPLRFINNDDDTADYGMMLFNFNVNGQPLKFFTGALGWQLVPGDNIQTTFRGYPNEGELVGCPNDGEHLCTWQGVVTRAKNDAYYNAKTKELGEGASGGPMIMNYDPNLNLGLLFSDYSSYDELNDQILAPMIDPIEFQALIGELTL